MTLSEIKDIILKAQKEEKKVYTNYFIITSIICLLLLFVIPILLIVPIIFLLYKIYLKEESKRVNLFFEHISKGKKAVVIGDFYCRFEFIHNFITLDNLYYIRVNIDNQTITIPILKEYLSEIKIALSNVNKQEYHQVINQLYKNENLTTSYTPTTIMPISEFLTYAKKEIILDLLTDKKLNKEISLEDILSILSIYFFKKDIQLEERQELFYKKEKIFTKIVNYINPTFSYVKEGHISLKEFLYSGLYIEDDYIVDGNDLIFGNYNGIPFQLCQLDVKLPYKNKQDRSLNYDNIFNGWYFIGNYPKKIPSPLIIVPKNNITNWFENNLNYKNLNKYLEDIDLEDPEFKKKYNIYCNDQIMARYILTPIMIEKIKQLYAQSKNGFFMVFHQHTIIIAIHHNKYQNTEFDEINFNSEIESLNLLNNLYRNITLPLQMVQSLQENTTTW